MYNSFYLTGDKNPKAEKYAQAYLLKAKIEKDTLEILGGYHLLADLYDREYSIATKYIDSAFRYNEFFNSEVYLGKLYGKKAYIERASGKFDKSLDNYLKQLELMDTTYNSPKHFTLLNIATLKTKVGQYNEAKSILKNSLSFEELQMQTKKWDSSSFFNTIAELVDTYRLNNEIDSAQTLHNEFRNSPGLNWAIPFFGLNDGILKYHQQKYAEAIESLECIIPTVNNIDNAFLFEEDHKINTYLFLGKSYEALGKEHLKISYYKKIDSISKSGYLIPEVRNVFKELITYYKKSGEREKQLVYINKLIEVDSILDIRYAYLSNKFYKDYDIPKLLEEKEKIINSLENKKSSIFRKYNIVFIALLITLLFLIYYFYKQQTYKRRFDELIKINSEKNNVVKNSATAPKKITLNDIPEGTINNILDKLKKFENQKGFVKNNINSQNLAKSFGTNTKYLSKVINVYKEKSFKQYLSDLRIDLATEKLKTDDQFRRYTIKAIAMECGFNNAEAFSKAFYKKNGIYPSYFIKKIK